MAKIQKANKQNSSTKGQQRSEADDYIFMKSWQEYKTAQQKTRKDLSVYERKKLFPQVHGGDFSLSSGQPECGTCPFPKLITGKRNETTPSITETLEDPSSRPGVGAKLPQALGCEGWRSGYLKEIKMIMNLEDGAVREQMSESKNNTCPSGE